jgi:hypothetical protein
MRSTRRSTRWPATPALPSRCALPRSTQLLAASSLSTLQRTHVHKGKCSLTALDTAPTLPVCGPVSSATPIIACCASQEAWDKTEDKPAAVILAFGGLIVLTTLSGVVDTIDKIPIINNLIELVGIVVTGWFTYRYLVFGPDR